MRLVGLHPMVGDYVYWQLTVPPREGEQEVSILFNLRPTDNPVQALHYILQYNEITWLSPAPEHGEWILDLDELRRSFPDKYIPMSWFGGTVQVYPSGIPDYPPMSWSMERIRVPPSYPETSLAGTPRTGVEFTFDASTPKA